MVATYLEPAAGASRKGITPVVAIILLLMMTVAAAGAAFTWFSQMQEQLQGQAERDLNTQLDVKDLQCDSGANYVNVSITNTGDREIELTTVNLYVRDSSGDLAGTVSGMDLTTSTSTSSCESGGGCQFGTPGGFDTVNIDLSGTMTLSANSFYDISMEFLDAGGYEIQPGGCLASDG